MGPPPGRAASRRARSGGRRRPGRPGLRRSPRRGKMSGSWWTPRWPQYIEDHQYTTILPDCIDACQYTGMSVTIPTLECCPALLQCSPLTQAEAEQLAAAFRAIADPTRLRLISLLASSPGG